MASRGDKILISLSAALLGVVGGAASTGLLVRDAVAQVSQPAARRREEEPAPEDLLLVVPPRDEGSTLLAAHRSHRSHSSHSSHYSGSSSHGSHYSGGGSRSYAPSSSDEPTYVAPVRKEKPAHVSFMAYPGGHIYVDGKLVGLDVTKTLKLSVGNHTIRVENRFLGETSVDVTLTDGQTGIISIEW